MSDVVEDMLGKAMSVWATNERKLAAEVSRIDNIVDCLDEAIVIAPPSRLTNNLRTLVVGGIRLTALGACTWSVVG
jgi:hypothetical protein